MMHQSKEERNTLITKQLWKAKTGQLLHVNPFQVLIHFISYTLQEQPENQKVLSEMQVVLVSVLTTA